MLATAKDPRKVRAGQAGARGRWGERRIVRLDTLEPPVAAAIRALIAADQEAKKAAVAVSETSATAAGAEVRRGVVDPLA